MSLIDDIRKFCKDLIVGDFENEPSNAAMVIGGLISLVPIVDQVMDVRDVAGMLYRINAKGGFKNATPDDCVDLALAAFGCIPEVGSVMKTGIKPLWKSRKKVSKVANAALHSNGVALIERLLHKKPGAVITFLKKDVLGKWANYTQQAITQTDNALTLTDQLLAELSTPIWWIPDDLEQLARTSRPSLQKMRGGIKGAVQSGSDELKQFVVSLIGEDGYRVVATAAQVSGGRATHNKTSAHASHRSATDTKTSHKKTENDKPVKHKENDHGKTVEKTRQDVAKGAGSQTNVTRPTLASLAKDMSAKLKGILGEHMADYYCQDTKGWGKGTAKHDAVNAINSNKLNDDGEMVRLFMPKGRGRGIDGVWRSNGSKPYAIIEAKCSEDPTKSLRSLLGEAGDKNGADMMAGTEEDSSGTQNSGKKKMKKKANSKGSALDTGGERSRQVNGKVTQMSHNWIIARIKKATLVDITAKEDISSDRFKSYSRHVLFFSIPHITAHMNALTMKATGKNVQDPMHAAHEITREWADSDIAKIADKRGGLDGSARDQRKR